MVIKSKDKTRASQRKGALSNWKVREEGKYLGYILVNMNICAENWENSGQVFEEERHQRRRSEEGDVGP